MNLIALSTGLVLEPRRMWRAFKRGWLSRNLSPAPVRAEVDAERWRDLAALRSEVLEVRTNKVPIAMRVCEFGVYSTLAMVIHVLLAVPAVTARFVTDITLGYTVFQAVKPKKRADLY
jgi:hypothetical protein